MTARTTPMARRSRGLLPPGRGRQLEYRLELMTPSALAPAPMPGEHL
jgi:hypothetical protein